MHIYTFSSGTHKHKKNSYRSSSSHLKNHCILLTGQRQLSAGGQGSGGGEGEHTDGGDRDMEGMKKEMETVFSLHE